MTARSHCATPSRSCARHVRNLLLILLFNIPVLLFSGRGFFAEIPAGTSVQGWCAALLAYASTVITYELLFLLVTAPLVLLVRRGWLTVVVVPVLLGMLNVLVYADSVIYRLFGIHFNGMVWNLLMTQGAGDSVSAGRRTILTGALVITLTLGVELFFSLFALRWFDRVERRRAFFSRKAMVAGLVVALAVVLVDKSVYAWGDLNDDEDYTRSRSLFPLYQPATIKHFAVKHLGVKLNRPASIRIRTKGSSLLYPRSPLVFDPDGRRPNILIVAVEGGRFDMMNPEVMPFLSNWSAGRLTCLNHYSGGNCSRFGVFCMVYGLGGSYWHRVLAERRAPVLVDELKKMDYTFRVLSCTDLNFPEFRKTAFLNIPEAITDTWDGPRVERDRRMTDRFIEFLDARDAGRPFFSFMFYDASHQPYLYPDAHKVFATTLEPDDIDYFRLADAAKESADPLKARFKNSLHYIDAQVGRALDALEQRGLMDNTLVFVTGDHGEEFGEMGEVGHNNSFARYQVGTFMAGHIPGVEGRAVTRITSHVDVAVTIFDYMGIANPRADYTLGTPLTAAQGPGYAFVAGWDDAAIIDDEVIIRFGLEIYNARMTVLDHTYRVLPKPRKDEILEQRSARLMEVVRGMRAFLR